MDPDSIKPIWEAWQHLGSKVTAADRLLLAESSRSAAKLVGGRFKSKADVAWQGSTQWRIPSQFRGVGYP